MRPPATEARLSDLGVTIVEAEVMAYLRNRLGIVAHRAAHPELGERPITRPLVIVGQPRTGTTILYFLLAQDPANRAPLSWEVDLPCPPPVTATYATDPRIDECEAAAEMADLLIPGFRVFHPIGARLAQECVRMTGSDFRSMIFTVQYEVPTYNRWLLDEADLAPTYRWHRIFLQHLQSGHMGERWLLKSPAHLWHLAERGLVDADGRATVDGRDLHAGIEHRTDELAIAPWARLDADTLEAVTTTLARLAGRVAGAGVIRFPNPMGLPAAG